MSKLNVVPIEPKLTLIGFSDKGAYIPIGTMPLENPEERYTIISQIFDEIDRCKKEEVNCRIGNVSFDPFSFDFFTVN